jgi:lipopolysaccharide transport system ATP-binding protein
MSETVIHVENLGKKYRIGAPAAGDLRNAFGHLIKRINPFSKNQGTGSQKDFWALKEINFEVKKGEAVGIIGRNGAGKSTLLKILSRITEPTTGFYSLNGRVSSLLEVGTGFHMELTGRENIFLNGTILGMRRREIRAKLDEIVDFSGVEHFIDTPVKHYSSGMKVRLAFSVAAHLEPEILIIDEVLAVGDAEFQKKCLGKMEDVTGQGRTVLFVSHNLGAVKQLCASGLLLDANRMIYRDNINLTVHKYLDLFHEKPSGSISGFRLNEFVRIKRLDINNSEIRTHDPLEFSLLIENTIVNQITDIALLIYDENQNRIAIIDLRDPRLLSESSRQKNIEINGRIDEMPLIEGTYDLGIYLYSNVCQGNFLNLLRFKVVANVKDKILYPKISLGYIDLKYSFRIK